MPDNKKPPIDWSLLRHYVPLEELKPSALLRFVMPDLRGPLGRYPENEANRGGIWIPAKRAAQVRDDGVLP